MIKFFQALLTGAFITFILDFFIFLGLYNNYIITHEINVYYNILFADNQNIYLFVITSIIIGAIFTYTNNTKLKVIVISFLSFVSLCCLIPVIGNNFAQMLFMQKNVKYQDSKYTYFGDVYYQGRKNITFYDYELKKIILINKKDLIK